MTMPPGPLGAPRRVRRLFLAGVLAASGLAPGPRTAFADDEVPAAETPKAKAGARLDEGIRLYQRGMFDAALAEFLESRRLYPFRSALFNAALCLEKLGRYDEAADQLEQLLREIDDENTPEGARDKERAQREIIEVSRRVGTVQIDGAEPGATLSIDGKQRGEYPLVRSLRVSAGNHTVRVFKSGFEPLEERVDVAGGASVRVSAALLPLARTGRVRIEETNGFDVTVQIDSNPVGKAPWQGMLAPGAHVVLLRGAGDLGTPPVSLAVEADKSLTLSLTAEDLASAVRVQPTPVNASVAIDKVTVGSGAWEGRLRPGAHTVEVAAPGFLPEIRRITLARGDRPTVLVELGRDPSSPFAPRVASFYVEGETAVVVAGTLAGGVERSCGGGCAGAPGLGGRALLRLGYEGNIGLGGGVEVGSLGAFYRATGRMTRLAPVGQDLPEIVTVDDSVWVRGATLGLFAGLSLAVRSGLLFHLRVGGGALVGSASDTRTSSADAGAAAEGLTIEPTGEKRALFGGYVATDVSLGLALGGGFSGLIGLHALAGFFPSPPQWGADHLVVAGFPDGRRHFGAFSETFADPLIGLGPTLGIRRVW